MNKKVYLNKRYRATLMSRFVIIRKKFETSIEFESDGMTRHWSIESFYQYYGERVDSNRLWASLNE